MNTTAQTTVDTEIRAVLERLYGAWADGDADAFAALYTDDATVAMPGVFHQGRDAVRSFMAAAFAGPLAESRGIDEVRDIRMLGGDAVVVSSVAGILMSGETEVPSDRERSATWVLVRDGDWRIAAYTNTPRH
ncbi:MAG: SgcJ/EcaC family oxidoreductase [Pseudonocardia sp.]|nr:SgcJ/EcaC family oxidoreductase [Pseudonocardia sp.]